MLSTTRIPAWSGALLAYACSLVILGGCERTSVSVLDVAFVDVSPDSLTLIEGDNGSLTATPKEEGGTALSGRAVSWEADDPGVAAVGADGAVEARAAGTTDIHATSEGVRGSATVVVLPAPSIELSPASLDFEATAGESGVLERTVEIRNGGAGVLDGLTVESRAADGGSAPWLEARLEDTTAPTTIRVRVGAGELEPGIHEGAVIVTSPAARDGAAEIAVRFEVAEPPPEIAVQPTSVSLGAFSGSSQPATQTVDVLNAGGGTLDGLHFEIHYETGSGWLQGELDREHAPARLTLRASARFLFPGEYRATVRVRATSAPGESADIHVVFRVDPAFFRNEMRKP